MQIQVLDNIGGAGAELPLSTAAEISDLIMNSVAHSNSGEFNSHAIIEILDFLSSFTPQKLVRSLADGYTAYVTDENGGVVGFAMIEKANGGYHLTCLYVSRDCQGRGIGSRLFELCEERMRSLGCKTMCVDAVNLNGTIGFYRRRGFSEYGRTAPNELFLPMSKAIR